MNAPIAASPDEARIREALMECYDPEIPVNVVDLGLLYQISPEAGGRVAIEMTLTTIGCPEAEKLVQAVRDHVEALDGVTTCEVSLVWDPPWNREMMTPDGRVMLRMLGF